jgi:general secretion pathway protein F
MPVFEYKALDVKGKTTSGIIDSDSAVAARQKLRSGGIFPVSVMKVDDTPTKKESGTYTLWRPHRRIRAYEVSIMTRQLSTLVGVGFPLVSAIDALIPNTKSQVLKKYLARIKDSIVEGNSFASALSLYPETFPPLYINMVRAGETSGTLEIVLERLAEITEKQQALKNKIQSALVYPILMLFIGSGVLFFLLVYIVPSITSIFADMNQVLPAPTRLLIAISNIFKSYWWGMLIIISVAVLAIHRAKKTEKGRYLVDKSLLFMPGLSLLTKKLAIARFSRTLGSLLENGVSMLPALEIAKNTADNVLISENVEEAAEEVGKGQPLATALAGKNIFPNLSIQMIQVGEQSGKLEEMLNKVADVFENEVETTVMRMTTMLEPLMILVMGVIVGFIVLSICLPIFEMNQLVM